MAIELSPEHERRFAELALAFTPEELCDELKPYVEEHPRLGRCLRHPLVYVMIFPEIENKRANMMLKLKRDAIEEAMAERNYETVVWLHERPYRLQAFLEIARRLTNARYWDLLGSLWTDCENHHQCQADWREALEGRGVRSRSLMMDEEEREKWRGLRRTRHPVLVYRGHCGKAGRDGLSWTLSQTRAEWFARRFAGAEGREEPYLAKGIVDPKHIIAYFDGRGEDEVVIYPENVVEIGAVAL